MSHSREPLIHWTETDLHTESAEVLERVRLIDELYSTNEEKLAALYQCLQEKKQEHLDQGILGKECLMGETAELPYENLEEINATVLRQDGEVKYVGHYAGIIADFDVPGEFDTVELFHIMAIGKTSDDMTRRRRRIEHYFASVPLGSKDIQLMDCDGTHPYEDKLRSLCDAVFEGELTAAAFEVLFAQIKSVGGLAYTQANIDWFLGYLNDRVPFTDKSQTIKALEYLEFSMQPQTDGSGSEHMVSPKLCSFNKPREISGIFRQFIDVDDYEVVRSADSQPQYRRVVGGEKILAGIMECGNKLVQIPLRAWRNGEE